MGRDESSMYKLDTSIKHKFYLISFQVAYEMYIYVHMY